MAGIADLIKQIFPSQNEFYSTVQLQNAYELLKALLKNTPLEVIAENLSAAEYIYLINVRALLTQQNEIPRAAVAARRDYLPKVLKYMDRLIETQLAREKPKFAVELDANLKYIHKDDKKAQEITTLLSKSIAQDEKLFKDKIYNIEKKITAIDIGSSYKKISAAAYIDGSKHNEINKLLEHHTEKHNYIRNIGVIAGLHQQIEAMQNIDHARIIREPIQRAASKPATRTKINTHTESIHKDASESALRLQKSFPAHLFRTDMSNIAWIFAKDKPNKFRDELLKVVCSELEQGENIPDVIKLEQSVREAFKNVLKNTEFKDPVSGISLSDIVKILLVGINSIENEETKKDSYLQLCKALYLLQEEYSYLPYSTGNTSSCDPGLFNGLIYSQATTLSDHVKIRMYSKSHATLAIGDKMQSLALSTLKSSDYKDANEFSEAVMERSKTEASKIVQEVVAEYYVVFGYESSEAAANDSTRLDEHCTSLCGCNVVDLFETLPIDFESMFNDAHKAYQNATMRPKPSN